MARDLLLGNTRRRWERGSSCGQVPPPPLFMTEKKRRELYQDVQAEADAPALGRQVGEAIQRNFQTIVRLGKNIPITERKAFGKFLQKWQEFSMPKNGKYAGTDYLELVNFRDANQKYTARLAELSAKVKPARVADSPSTGAPTASAPPASAPPPPPVTLARVLLPAALGLAGVLGAAYLLENKNESRPYVSGLARGLTRRGPVGLRRT